MARIELKQLRHSYLTNPRSEADYALKEVNHTFDDGGAYALLGPSGCGKTTLLSIISGLVTASEGQVLFDGEDVTEQSTEQRNIAQVFQFPVIYDTMTVAQNLAFPLRNRRLPEDEIGRRVAEILEMIGLTERANRRARGLTADQKQKISLGRGLVRSDVNAILFDEPLTVIDPHMKWQLRSQLKQLHRRRHRRRDVRGPDRPDRDAERAVREAAAHLRGLLHRLARHECAPHSARRADRAARLAIDRAACRRRGRQGFDDRAGRAT
jgi:glycerol transport system ATP-binding protein